ncbi:MAG: hypothetical protein K2K89_05710 [Ruminococcus sp.]|nr:hypothetical protein [Ruminococcus sp.]
MMNAYGFDRKITESECVAELETLSEIDGSKVMYILRVCVHSEKVI